MKLLHYNDNNDGSTTLTLVPVSYKKIWAAVNSVKPCRFVTRAGRVSFELIETEDDESGLLDKMIESLTNLGVEFIHDEPRTYKFPDTAAQRRTYFRVYK